MLADGQRLDAATAPPGAAEGHRGAQAVAAPWAGHRASPGLSAHDDVMELVVVELGNRAGEPLE